jgi:hypothetical protein
MFIAFATVGKGCHEQEYRPHEKKFILGPF